MKALGVSLPFVSRKHYCRVLDAAGYKIARLRKALDNSHFRERVWRKENARLRELLKEAGIDPDSKSPDS